MTIKQAVADKLKRFKGGAGNIYDPTDLGVIYHDLGADTMPQGRENPPEPVLSFNQIKRALRSIPYVQFVWGGHYFKLKGRRVIGK